MVYVDDFLLQTSVGTMRTSLLEALGRLWTLAKEAILSVSEPITFLGVQLRLRDNGDVLLSQTAFTENLLQKHEMDHSNAIKCIQMGPIPEKLDVPDARVLKQLQGFSGEFNWLATRTRPDIAYYTSLLASSCTKFATWSLELAKKILRFLQGTRDQGIRISATGAEDELKVWTDAGYAGADTRSQSGLVVTWAGSVIVWRSSRQTVSALSTAEAELNSAALGWQIAEGLRLLLQSYGVSIDQVKVLIDNRAAITIAECGANWRTRYFAVRGHRLHEEAERGAISLEHCPTGAMIADCLTKLATAPVIQVLHEAMLGDTKRTTR